jgi:hypothetical protein
VTLTNLSSSPERSGIYGGQTLFNDASSAGEAIIINEGGNGRTLRGGQTIFAGTATAANARITAEGGKVPHAQGADVTFNENATAGEAVITVGGGSGVRSTGATIHFEDGSTAGHAVLTANGGEKQGGGGYIFSTETAMVKAHRSESMGMPKSISLAIIQILRIRQSARSKETESPIWGRLC